MNGDVSNNVRGAPWRAADWTHGQRTVAFQQLPLLMPFQEDQPIPARPFPAMCTWKAVFSGVISVITSLNGSAPASPDMRPTLMTLGRMPTNHNLHHCFHSNHHSHYYYTTHAPTVIKSYTFHTKRF